MKTQSTSNAGTSPALALTDLTVVAIDERPMVRATFERNVAEALQGGAVAVKESNLNYSMEVLKGDREALRQKFAAAGVRFVLATKVGERVTSTSPVRVGGAGNGFDWTDVDTARYEFYTSGGGIKTELRLDSKLYRVADGTVVWSATTQTVLEENFVPEKVLRAAARSLAGKMKSDGLLR